MTRVADPPPINPDPNAPGPITPCDTHPIDGPVVPATAEDVVESRKIAEERLQTIQLDSAE